MKKKILTVIFLVILCISMVACNKVSVKNTDQNKKVADIKLDQKPIEFNSKTLEGKEIDSSILKESNITMINIWATFCEPCIKEMPDIQQLYEEVKEDKVNIIGIISDTPHSENEELAKQIISAKDVKYINIIPDDNIINNLFEDISAVPTTIFVDSEGNIVGDFIVGTRSKEEYKKEIEDRLKSMN